MFHFSIVFILVILVAVAVGAKPSGGDDLYSILGVRNVSKSAFEFVLPRTWFACTMI